MARKKVAKKKSAKKTTRKTSSTRSSTKKTSKRKSLPVMPAHKPETIDPNRYRPTRAVAIVSLIINILLIPGLGTIIGGRTKTGVWQIILLCVGLLTTFIIIGGFLLVATWVWALVSSIRILQDAV